MAQRESHSFQYFLIGAAAGLVGGLLLATKPGSELREDLVDYGEKGRSWARRMVDKIPFRVKAAGAVGAVKGAGGEAIREAREGVQESIS